MACRFESDPRHHITRPIITPQSRFIILASLFVLGTGNRSLFERLLEIYPPQLSNLPALSVAIAFFAISTVSFFLLVCQGRGARWLLAFFLIACSQAAYYMDEYRVVIDVVMFDNIFQTNLNEFSGLVSSGLILKTLIFGVLPAWLTIKYCPRPVNTKFEFISRLKLVGILVIGLAVMIGVNYASFSHFVREDVTTRKFANPTYFTYSLFKYSSAKIKSLRPVELKAVASDAKKISREKRRLLILVVGEGARADRFSLNGYARETNPELKKLNVISFAHATSCGTSTGESIPCMFSVLTQKEFKRDKAREMENALDILSKAGVAVLWRDNNSDSKDVATRVTYEDYKSPARNPMCDRECRDTGMLEGLDQFIANQPEKDILIVLHQMGNHGPEYYRRYPKEFERFTPTCTRSQLKECSKAEIDNAYDNAILYTDHFLAKTISLLKNYDEMFETAMLYVSDHGESLGENGVYLHAAPYDSAPKEQLHIPVVVWLGSQLVSSFEKLKTYRNVPVTHDDLFCSLLFSFNVKTSVCAAWENSLSKRAQ